MIDVFFVVGRLWVRVRNMDIIKNGVSRNRK